MGITALLMASLLLLSADSLSQHYAYVCSYSEMKTDGMHVLFSKVDLETKMIVFNKEIPISGQISTKTPIRIEGDGIQNYFLSTVEGLFGHNTKPGIPRASFAITDEDGNILKLGELSKSQVVGKVDTLESSIILLDSTDNKVVAKISIADGNELNLTKIAESVYQDEDYPAIGPFRYFEKLDKNNNRIYWSLRHDNISSNGAYLILVDQAKQFLIDSLNVADYSTTTPLFLLSENDSLAYVFFLNHKCLENAEYGEVLTPDPSFVKIYSATDLTFMDSIAIENPPLDSGCASEGYSVWDRNILERSGPYFWYFFMQFEAIETFVPAMLFIFDTRTNEAIWLRVGWR